MSWATIFIRKLQDGETVQFRPKGNSMTPRIENGQLCTVVPATTENLVHGAIVLCTVKGRDYLHYARTGAGGSGWVISNGRGFVNGTVNRKQIHGVLVKVED